MADDITGITADTLSSLIEDEADIGAGITLASAGDGYDVTAGSANASSQGDDNEVVRHTFAGGTNADGTTTTSTTTSTSDYEIVANDVSIDDLKAAIVNDYDDGMDEASYFSDLSFGVTFSDGSTDTVDYASEAMDELQDGTAQMGKVFSQVTQQSYNIQQILANLTADYGADEAAAQWDVIEPELLANMAQEYNSAKGLYGDDAVSFASMDEAFGYIIVEMEPGMEALNAFMTDIPANIDTLQSNSITNETLVNAIMQAGSVLVSIGTGIGAVRSIGATGQDGADANELIDVVQSALVSVGVNVGFAADSTVETSGSTYTDFSGMTEVLLSASSETNSFIQDMFTMGDTFAASAYDMVNFARTYQNVLVDVIEQVPEAGVGIGTTAEYGRGDEAERLDLAGTAAQGSISSTFTRETLFVNQSQDNNQANVPDWGNPFSSVTTLVSDATRQEMATGYYAQEGNYANQYASAFVEDDFISVRSIPRVFYTERFEEANTFDDYQFQTPFNTDLWK